MRRLPILWYVMHVHLLCLKWTSSPGGNSLCSWVIVVHLCLLGPKIGLSYVGWDHNLFATGVWVHLRKELLPFTYLASFQWFRWKLSMESKYATWDTLLTLLTVCLLSPRFPTLSLSLLTSRNLLREYAHELARHATHAMLEDGDG